tara:strand:+ start:3371 stop:3517 length:147 start_codon:yes stop_codon:yes gene_type:complete
MKKDEQKKTTWSVKVEGKLNPNNIIFRDKKYKELVDSLKDYNKSLIKR